MKSTKKISALLLGAALLGGPAVPYAGAAKAPQIAVIVKADGELADISLKDIKAIYTGEKLYQGSNKIEPLVNGDEAVEGVFFKKVLQKTKAQFKKIWNSKAFVDALPAPAVLPDSNDVLKAVYKNDSAIGFVLEDDVTPAQKKLVKIIYLTDQSE